MGIHPGPDLASKLEKYYHRYNDRRYVPPDPLQFLYNYTDLQDREIVGILASSLAFGNVKTIVRSVESALQRLPQPLSAISEWGSLKDFHDRFKGFRHRFVTGVDVGNMLYGVRGVQMEWGSLGSFFEAQIKLGISVWDALASFAEALRNEAGGHSNYLLPCARAGSACKRLNLYMRWMVRRDQVDPGGWDSIPTERLIVPLDTHMHRIGRILGFTRRKQADRKAAMEVTDGFRRISPADPVRYDFALTRLGMGH